MPNETRISKSVSREMGVDGRGGHLCLTSKNSKQGGYR
jgi:hypothetical protein